MRTGAAREGPAAAIYNSLCSCSFTSLCRVSTLFLTLSRFRTGRWAGGRSGVRPGAKSRFPFLPHLVGAFVRSFTRSSTEREITKGEQGSLRGKAKDVSHQKRLIAAGTADSGLF